MKTIHVLTPEEERERMYGHKDVKPCLCGQEAVESGLCPDCLEDVRQQHELEDQQIEDGSLFTP